MHWIDYNLEIFWPKFKHGGGENFLPAGLLYKENIFQQNNLPLKRCFKSNLFSQTVIYKLSGLVRIEKIICGDEPHQRHIDKTRFSRHFQRWRYEESYHHTVEDFNFHCFYFPTFLCTCVSLPKPLWEGAPQLVIQSTVANSVEFSLNSGLRSCSNHYEQRHSAGFLLHNTGFAQTSGCFWYLEINILR